MNLDLSWTSILLIALGLFLVGGVVSFIKQGVKVVALVLAVLAGLALASGVLRL